MHDDDNCLFDGYTYIRCLSGGYSDIVNILAISEKRLCSGELKILNRMESHCKRILTAEKI